MVAWTSDTNSRKAADNRQVRATDMEVAETIAVETTRICSIEVEEWFSECKVLSIVTKRTSSPYTVSPRSLLQKDRTTLESEPQPFPDYPHNSCCRTPFRIRDCAYFSSTRVTHDTSVTTLRPRTLPSSFFVASIFKTSRSISPGLISATPFPYSGVSAIHTMHAGPVYRIGPNLYGRP